MTAMPAPADLDQPVPFTLTPKAHAALAVEAVTLVDGPRPVEAADEWACEICADAYFGPRPDDGRCPDCRGTR